MPRAATLITNAVTVVGLSGLFLELYRWTPGDPVRLACYSALAILASCLRVVLPATTATISVRFFFVVVGVAQLPRQEVIIAGCIGALFQALWHATSEWCPNRALFDMGVAVVGIAATDFAYGSAPHLGISADTPLAVLLAASGYFLVSTFASAAAVSSSGGKGFRALWRESYSWCLPYYFVGACIAWVILQSSQTAPWRVPLLSIGAEYVIYQSYRLYIARFESKRQHLDEIIQLHLRTIEALAAAVEAQDCSTHQHLRRVRVYAVQMARHLGLSPDDIEGLQAAALLHDIGKLAVPQHIVAKPGKLTPEEYEKLKIHSVVGAKIVERVQFPYPVAPIVRAHHENWDGSGYPDGLKGDAIPIAARILTAVDVFDALTSARPYRCAMPLDEAMRVIATQAGKTFDPRVVEALAQNYRTLEPLARSEAHEAVLLPRDFAIASGGEPATGLAKAQAAEPEAPRPELSSIAAACHEAHALFELVSELGNSLDLDDTLSVIATWLKKLVPYDALTIWLSRGSTLLPACVKGDDYGFFSSLEIPIGEGLSGWVAQNRQAMLNGAPSNEASYVRDRWLKSRLGSALCVPLEGSTGMVGVLAAYVIPQEAFTREDLRILTAVSTRVSVAIENALKYQQVKHSAIQDSLTNLPNARGLSLRLDTELPRARRAGTPLAVIVGDLDGFKALNDTLGHLEGNRALQVIAKALQQACRPYDFVARMGGDEFAIVLPGIDSASVFQAMLRFHEAVTDAVWERYGNGCLSMTMGGAAFPADADSGPELLAAADAQMYNLKRMSRPSRPARFEKDASALAQWMSVSTPPDSVIAR